MCDFCCRCAELSPEQATAAAAALASGVVGSSNGRAKDGATSPPQGLGVGDAVVITATQGQFSELKANSRGKIVSVSADGASYKVKVRLPAVDSCCVVAVLCVVSNVHSAAVFGMTTRVFIVVRQVGPKTYKCRPEDFKAASRNLPPADLVGADVLVKHIDGVSKKWVPAKVVGITTQDR